MACGWDLLELEWIIQNHDFTLLPKIACMMNENPSEIGRLSIDWVYHRTLHLNRSNVCDQLRQCELYKNVGSLCWWVEIQCGWNSTGKHFQYSRKRVIGKRISFLLTVDSYKRTKRRSLTVRGYWKTLQMLVSRRRLRF